MVRIICMLVCISALGACNPCPLQPALNTEAPTARVTLGAGESLAQRFEEPRGGDHQDAEFFIDASPAAASMVTLYDDPSAAHPDAGSPKATLKPQVDDVRVVTAYTIYRPVFSLTAGTYAIVLKNTSTTESLSVGVYTAPNDPTPAQILSSGGVWQDLPNQKVSFTLGPGLACQ